MRDHRQYTRLLHTYDAAQLLALMDLEAHKHYDGHYTIFSFTTGYKAAFGTPDLDHERGRLQLAQIPNSPSMQAALVAALVTKRTFDDFFNDEVLIEREGRIDWGVNSRR